MSYINDDFLLDTPSAVQLYNEWAKDMPIIDYHNHLPPEQLAQDYQFADLADAWLAGDHYKWRAMRANGVDESLCTGDASPREKFQAWAETVPRLVRNQLYPWTHLELKRIFGIDTLLNGDSAESIWNACNEQLASPEFSARGLLAQSKVEIVCTTDDPVHTLEHHRSMAQESDASVRMLPAWRPDKGMAIDSPEVFNSWLDDLAAASDVEIIDWDSYLIALRKRHDFFNEQGCRLSDHGIDTFYAEPYRDSDIRSYFDTARSGVSANAEETAQFKSAMLYEWGVMDAEKGWTQQYHVGAMRNVNAKMFSQLGPDTGFDTIGDNTYAKPMARLFDRLNSDDRLAKTIVYNIHPRDNDLLVSILGAFNDGITPGKMQHGSGWWFMDQKDGMEQQINALSQNGMLSRFVGMLTDSRSFLSFPRHEYFRRLLCGLLGRDMEKGLIPGDFELIGPIVSDICYNNVVNYFEF